MPECPCSLLCIKLHSNSTFLLVETLSFSSFRSVFVPFLLCFRFRLFSLLLSSCTATQECLAVEAEVRGDVAPTNGAADAAVLVAADAVVLVAAAAAAVVDATETEVAAGTGVTLGA